MSSGTAHADLGVYMLNRSGRAEMRRILPVLMSISLVAFACGGDDTVETTLTTESVATTEAPTTSAAVDVPETTVGTTSTEESPVTTTEVVVGIPTYEVIGTADLGVDTLIVVIEPGDFTNVELENLAIDIVDRFAPAAALVVSSMEAADLAMLEALTDDEEMQLQQATLISIENGIEVTFLGPYADVPGLTIGS